MFILIWCVCEPKSFRLVSQSFLLLLILLVSLFFTLRSVHTRFASNIPFAESQTSNVEISSIDCEIYQ